MEKAIVLEALQKGTLELQGQFLSGSNYTFLGEITAGDISFQAVYKPVRGEQPLWDFPQGSLAGREVAAYLVSEALGWDLVPPTVFRKDGPLGKGSVQQYIDHDPEDHFFNFAEKDRQRLRVVAVFDILLNNADRKGGHILRDAQDHFWLIDHGLCFHTQNKLRTVIWEFSDEEIPPDLLEDVEQFAEQLEEGRTLFINLLPYLHPEEIAALQSRALHICRFGRFPHQPSSRRSYPWPPI